MVTQPDKMPRSQADCSTLDHEQKEKLEKLEAKIIVLDQDRARLRDQNKRFKMKCDALDEAKLEMTTEIVHLQTKNTRVLKELGDGAQEMDMLKARNLELELLKARNSELELLEARHSELELLKIKNSELEIRCRRQAEQISAEASRFDEFTHALDQLTVSFRDRSRRRSQLREAPDAPDTVPRTFKAEPGLQHDNAVSTPKPNPPPPYARPSHGTTPSMSIRPGSQQHIPPPTPQSTAAPQTPQRDFDPPRAPSQKRAGRSDAELDGERAEKRRREEFRQPEKTRDPRPYLWRK